MSTKRKVASKPNAPDPFIGRRVRIRCEAEVVCHYESGPTAPERVSVRVDGIITIVPVARVEVLR